MKRILVIILSMLYMASATGATVHIHYCMGKFMSASLTHNEEGICRGCGMKKSEQKKGCCKDEQKTFKVGDHKLVKALFHYAGATPAIVPALPQYACHTYPCCHGIVKDVSHFHSPPSLWRACPIYLLVQDFRI